MPKTKEQLAEERRQTGNIIAESRLFMDMDCSRPGATWNSEKIFIEPAAASWSVRAEMNEQSEVQLWLTIDGPKSEAILSNFYFSLEVPGLPDSRRFMLLKSKCYGVGTYQTIAALIKNGKLQLTFILRVKYSGHPRLREKVPRPTAHKETLLGNFQNLLENPILSDFKFVVKGSEFKVHRSILAAVSPMLRKMFTIDMTESKEGVSRVDHIEPKAFGDMLKFVYGGEISENINARELYSAADYYQIEPLKKICEQEVHSSLNISNALEIFVWAHPYGELEALKFDAWDVIKAKILMRLGTHDVETSNLDGVKKIVDAALVLKKAIVDFKENLIVDEEPDQAAVDDLRESE